MKLSSVYVELMHNVSVEKRGRERERGGGGREREREREGGGGKRERERDDQHLSHLFLAGCWQHNWKGVCMKDKSFLEDITCDIVILRLYSIITFILFSLSFFLHFLLLLQGGMTIKAFRETVSIHLLIVSTINYGSTLFDDNSFLITCRVELESIFPTAPHLKGTHSSTRMYIRILMGY